MIIKYGADIEKETVLRFLNKITNRIFKILPMREEGGEWRSSLNNLIVEVAGMDSLMLDQLDCFSLLCKMEGLLSLDTEDDFMLFRTNIFECLHLVSKLKECLH